MATKKKGKVTASLIIQCYNNEECSVDIDGPAIELITALASLMSYEDGGNHFRELMAAAIKVVLDADKAEKKKKAAPKKKAAKKKA